MDITRARGDAPLMTRAHSSWLLCLLLLGCTDDEGDVEESEPLCHGPGTSEYTAVVSGADFREHEGKVVYGVTDVELASSKTPCRATGSARVVDARFEIVMTNVTDGAAYPFVGAFIDIDDDERCDESFDMRWGSIQNLADVTAAVTPADFSLEDQLGRCARLSPE